MKPSRDKRIIIWNTRAEHPPEEKHTWYLLIINEPKMIARIRQRLYEQLGPVEEIREYRDESLPGHDVRVLCFSLDSPKHELDRRMIYQGNWFKDRELYDRRGLGTLIDRRIREVTGKL